ncbi:helix-turn-helix domain-containing protein [Gottschalkia purinilytica]|uniref:helix-turn-helix domain-containing protein n=1 Tax=Gottschalkia purinilytica TaxID=1503 RepID=UPI00067D544A|nr:helix-turn-helix transcriptional regulator [Gottschalkia purinilytica]
MKKLRRKRNMTQKQLARLLGVSQVYISRIENGHIEGLTIGKLIRLAKILRVTPSNLLEVLLKIRKRR